MSYHGFGQIVYPVAVVGTAVANVAINADHIIKVGKIQSKQQQVLDTDAAKMDYIKTVILRVRSLGPRLARGGKYRPGTKAFEVILAKALKNDMSYKGYCNADIYVPFGPNDTPGNPRGVWASITRGGQVKSGSVPRDVGPIWATGCKNAEDDARMAWIKKFKGERKFSFLRAHKEDIGTMNLALRFGTGLFMAAALLLLIKVQRAVVKEQD